MPSPQALTDPRRNPGLDLLRGLSILLVVVHHVGLRIPLKAGVLAGFVPKRVLDAFIYNGYEAVFVFFVLSGFLITTNTLQRWGDLPRIDARAFYARRAARILPCLLALVAVLAALHGAGFQDFVIGRNGQTLGRTALSALALHLNWYEGVTGWLPGNWDVLWSLSIEEVFYLGFPAACLLLRRRWALVPALALLALSLPATRAALAARPIWQEKAYLPGMAGIALGVLAALAAEPWQPRRAWVRRAVGLAGALGLVAVLGFEDLLWKRLGNGTMLVLTGSAALLCLACHWRARDPRPWRLRGTGWLQSFGRLSYEIYLTHMFVVWPVVRAFKATGGGLRWGIVWYVPAVVASWGLGWLVARLLSGPAERWLRDRWVARTPASAAEAQAV